MICKNCGKELDADELICTQCGCDNTPEQEEMPARSFDPWKIAFPAVVSVALLLVLGWLLYFGVNGYWIPRANDIYNKDSYTVSEERLQASRDTVVATMGKYKLTNAQLRVFYSRVCAENWGAFDSSVPLDQQIFDEKTGLTWQQYLLQLALNTWKEYRILNDMAMDAGFKLSADYQESLDSLRETLEAAAEKNGYDSMEALLADDVCKGCTFEDYRYLVELNYYANQYYAELAANVEIPLEELNAFFEENIDILAEKGITKDSGVLVDFRQIFVGVETSPDGTTLGQWDDCKVKAQHILEQWLENDPSEESFHALAAEKSEDTKTASKGGLMSYIPKDYFTRVDVRHILIMPEGGTKSDDGKTVVYSDAEWEACRQKAQAVYDMYLNGERTEESFSDLAKEHSEDGNADEGGIYTDVTKDYMVEEFDAWIFDESRQPGDTGLVKTQYGYHVMYFVHRDGALNDWLFDSQRKYGDYGLVQSDDGYRVVFLSDVEEGWIRVCSDALAERKAMEVLTELEKEYELNVKYSKIRLSE